MRKDLKALFDSGGGRLELNAKVGFRRSNIKFAGKLAMQKLLLNVRNGENLITDHCVMTVGKEIPAVPIIYSRIMPGASIRFMAEIFQYTRKSDMSNDYGIKLVKLLEATL
jgi:hypothetical protein